MASVYDIDYHNKLFLTNKFFTKCLVLKLSKLLKRVIELIEEAKSASIDKRSNLIRETEKKLSFTQYDRCKY